MHSVLSIEKKFSAKALSYGFPRLDITSLEEPTISNGDWGWLCSDFKPVYDSKGECVCIVGCDYDMNDFMNNLKHVNDEHGHKSGDMYIIGCCRMVCEAFKHSPVYRIGGDEFVVILQGADYRNRKQICDRLKEDFEKIFNRSGAEPWQRYSAAVGMAENASDDITVELVFKRADKAMYENKSQFKRKYFT